MTEEEEEEETEEEEKSKTIVVERPISRAFVDCSSVLKKRACASRSGNDVVVIKGGERKADCIFFPRFDDASESFSLDVLLVVVAGGKLEEEEEEEDSESERGKRRKKNDDDSLVARSSFVHFRTDGFVSKPKGGVIYENWYQRAKEALSPRGEGRDDAYYEISIEEKNKKRSGKKKEVGGGGGGDDDDQDDDGEEVDVKLLVWRFPGEEEERPYSGSCDIKRVAEAPETGTSVAGGDATGTAATTKTKTKTKTTAATMAVLLELLRHSSAKYIREMEKNVDLKRANECLRRDQELAVKEESRKARDIEQFKRKCLEECLVLVNEKKKRIRELEEILETARKENDALTRKLEKKGGKERRKASSSSASDEEDYSSSEDESDEDEGEEEEEEEEEEANTDDEDKDTQVRKRMRQTAMADTIKTTASNGGRKKPKSTTAATTKATASQKQKSKPAARGANTFDALMQANLGRDSDDNANSQSSSF